MPESLAGVRVDRAVSILTGVSRSEAATLVGTGRVLLDGAPVMQRSAPLVGGSVLSVELPDAAAPLEPDSSVAFDVVYEDPDLVVVDKPSGVVVHPGAGTRAGTLVAGLLARYPDIGALAPISDPLRPGVVHRLDKGTSGLLVVARSAVAYRSLVAQMGARTVGRRYLALVAGTMADDQGVVDAPIGRSTRTPTKMAVVPTGRPARTRYLVLGRYDGLCSSNGWKERPATLLACALETGRTHQIRVHFAAIGHPVIGDERYGTETSRKILAPGRLFLHAAELSIDHPVSGSRMTWTSELPPDLRVVLAGDGARPS
ncbi:MAG TPA: RluA family pseudouridine synthase [Acidimicrobiales bacterium]|nr:RluA family pseudouridine synthase [Acidimicrobiales bacterium]